MNPYEPREYPQVHMVDPFQAAMNMRIKELENENERLRKEVGVLSSTMKLDTRKSSIRPEQMEDGKQYAVTVDGVWNAPNKEAHTYGWLDLPNGELEDFHLAHATSILECTATPSQLEPELRSVSTS